MLCKQRRWLFVWLCSLPLWLFCLAATAAEEVPLQIAGHSYTALVERNERPQRALAAHRALAGGEHYQGRIQDVPDSWVRLSRIDGRWQGAASIYGEVYLIEPEPTAGAAASAQALSDLPDAPACGTPGSQPEHPLAQGAHSALALPSAAAFQGLCESTVDDVCLIKELEVVFDREFQQRFPDTYVDQALSLINIVEGFYFTSLNIIFETLTLEFPGEEYFGDSTTTSGLLSDVNRAKRMGELPFLRNPQALLHLVTGRRFTDGYIGRAYVGTLCSTGGTGSGVSQFYRSTPATAVLVAHELGHNFGARHDGQHGNTCGPGYIMRSVIDVNATTFSSCSLDYMQGTIAGLAEPEACFKFPAAGRLAPAADNPAQVQRAEPFQQRFQIAVSNGYRPPETVQVTGAIENAAGQILAARLGAEPCELNAAGDAYSCSLSLPAAELTLTLEARGDIGDSIAFAHALNVSGEHVRDLANGAHRLVEEVRLTPLSAQPDDLQALAEADALRLAWSDSAWGGAGYSVRRRQGEDGSWVALADALPPGSSAFVDTTIDKGVFYQYQVVAVGVAGNGSNIVTAISEAPPTAPGQLQAELAGGVQLSWQAADDNATGFAVQRQRLAGEWRELGRTAAEVTRFADSTALAEHEYRYRVLAFNHSHESAPSEPVAIVMPAVDPPPREQPEDAPVHRRGGGGSLTPGVLGLLLLSVALARLRARSQPA